MLTAQFAKQFLAKGTYKPHKNGVVSFCFKTARTEISASKPEEKLFRLLGSSSLHVNTPK